MGYTPSTMEPKRCKICQNIMSEQFDSYVDTCMECLPENSRVLKNADGVWVWEKAVE